MTDDLGARILAAIEETERIAKSATSGPWRVNDETYPEYLVNDEGTTPVAGGRWGGEAGVFEEEGDAHHIAHNDPTTVLRHCAADRRTVERHKAAGHACLGDADNPASWRPYCDTCGSGEPNEYPTWWPCDTLLDRAAAYDITVDDAR